MKKLKRKRLNLLNDLEVKELYALPEFTEQERIYFFTLNPVEEAILNRVHSTLKCNFLWLLKPKKNFSRRSVI